MSQLKLLERRAREVGQIKMGRMVKNRSGKTYPSSLNWFEVLKRNQAGEWVRDTELHVELGETPTSINVVFFSEKLDEVFHSELALYRKKSGGRFCSGDQVTATLRLFAGDVLRFDEEDRLECHRNVLVEGRQQLILEAARPITIGRVIFEAMLDGMDQLEQKTTPSGELYWQCLTQKALIPDIACESNGCPLTQSDNPKCQCKPKGMLRVMLMDAPSFGAHHVLRTGSWNSIKSILATLEMVVERVGSLGGIPFKLKCQQENITDGQGKNRLVTVAHLEVVGTLTKMLELAEDHTGRRLALGRNQAALAPPKPIEQELEDTDSDYAAEFAPGLDEEIADATVEAVDEGPSLDDDMNQDKGSDIPSDVPGDFALPAAEEPDKGLDISQDNPSTPAPEDEVQAFPEVPDFDL